MALEKPSVSSELAQQLLEQHWNISNVTLKSLESYDDQNYLVKTQTPQNYLLKIASWMNSTNPNYFQEQSSMLEYVSSKESSFQITKPIRTTSNQLQIVIPDVKRPEKQCVVRLFKFLEGETLHNVTMSNQHCYEIGKMLAALHNSLEGTDWPQLKARESFQWSLLEVPQLKQHLNVVTDVKKRHMVEEILCTFEAIQSDLETLPRVLIHGDLNESNVVGKWIFDEHDNEKRFELYGILDWGDCHYAPEICDLATACCYAAIFGPELATAYVLSGYVQLRPKITSQITSQQFTTLIASRFCQSLVYGLVAYNRDKDPYVVRTQVKGWSVLENIWKTKLADQLLQSAVSGADIVWKV